MIAANTDALAHLERRAVTTSGGSLWFDPMTIARFGTTVLDVRPVDDDTYVVVTSEPVDWPREELTYSVHIFRFYVSVRKSLLKMTIETDAYARTDIPERANLLGGHYRELRNALLDAAELSERLTSGQGPDPRP